MQRITAATGRLIPSAQLVSQRLSLDAATRKADFFGFARITDIHKGVFPNDIARRYQSTHSQERGRTPSFFQGFGRFFTALVGTSVAGACFYNKRTLFFEVEREPIKMQERDFYEFLEPLFEESDSCPTGAGTSRNICDYIS